MKFSDSKRFGTKLIIKKHLANVGKSLVVKPRKHCKTCQIFKVKVLLFLAVYY